MTIEDNSDAWHQINNEERQQADLDKQVEALKKKYAAERKKRIEEERKLESLKSENKKLKKDLEEWDQGKSIKRFLPE